MSQRFPPRPRPVDAPVISEETTDAIRTGEHAASLLRDPVLTSVLDDMEVHAIQTWKTADDVRGREQAHASLMAVEAFRDGLQRRINEGDLARRKFQ